MRVISSVSITSLTVSSTYCHYYRTRSSPKPQLWCGHWSSYPTNCWNWPMVMWLSTQWGRRLFSVWVQW